MTALTSYRPPAPVLPVVMGVPSADILMPVDLLLTSRIPLESRLICTAMLKLMVPRINVRVPGTVPPPAVTGPEVMSIVQGSNMTGSFPGIASGPWLKVKIQDPKVVLPLDFGAPLGVKSNDSPA